MPRGTRERILDEAMRLFGGIGYTATTIAAIEQAAGLSPGSGAVYRHFATKKDILTAGVQRQIDTNAELLRALRQAPSGDEPKPPLRRRLELIAGHALERLSAERDLNRLVLRDLEQHPELLEAVRAQEMVPVRQALAAMLGQDAPSGTDVEALAAVLVCATSHFWLLNDVFGAEPSSVSRDRFLATLADLAATYLTRSPSLRDQMPEDRDRMPEDR
jgi:AcrR family transcriptional regulator